MLDVSTRLAVIVGGGAVAARKARGLFDAGAAAVRVVSPAFCDEVPAAAERVTANYEPGHLDGAGIAFAATDVPAVNDAVVRDCGARGILVSRADQDDDAPGDFSTPALLRRGAVAVTVSAGSPALAATIRDGLAGRWDERWSKMADAMRELRPMIVRDPALSPARRAELFRWLATEPALASLERGGVEELRRALASAPG